MKRVFYPFESLEEYSSGMWRNVTNKERGKYAANAAKMMRDSEWFLRACCRAIKEWPRSSEMALSCKGSNRQAWIGHASACVEFGSPEDATRLGWRMLTHEEQNEANRVADIAIKQWEQSYAKT